MAHVEHAPSDFVSTFRQRFAPLFGRKIARQRAEQYLGGLLGGRAERRNVTSLADTVDGATARALGWLLNKSPWPTRPVVDELQAYVGHTFGTADGLFTLNLDSFVKRGDNAVGVDKQYVHQLGRTSNCQIGVFLAYGSEQDSALVDAAIYMPHSWIDDAARREKAGVPESLAYQPRSALALDLLRQARTTGQLPGQWVTAWQAEGIEDDLRDRLDADGWRYLLPAGDPSSYFSSPDATEPYTDADVLGNTLGGSLQLARAWEPSADGARRPFWLLSCVDPLTGDPVAFVSNAPEDTTAEAFERVLAARWETVRMLAARCAGVNLDVYRVRGWGGWHRHVALALLASAFRACLPALADMAEEQAAEATSMLAFPVAADPEDSEPSALEAHAPSDAAAAAPVPVIPPFMEEEMAVSIEESETGSEPAPTEIPEIAPSTDADTAVATVYKLAVDLSGSEWRAVRAFQVWLVADSAGEIVDSSPSKADIEAEEVGVRMDVRIESTWSLEQILAALDEVPEITILELIEDVATAAPARSDTETAVPAVAATYHLVVDMQQTDWRAVRAFQVWRMADEAGTILDCSPSRAEIERQEISPTMDVRFESAKSIEQLLADLDEVPEITVLELVAEAVSLASDDDGELGDAGDMLAALEAELSARTNARDAGLMPAFEGPAEVISNAVTEASLVLEEARELATAQGAHETNGANGHANGTHEKSTAAAALGDLVTPTTPPVAPPTEGPVRQAAAAQLAPAPNVDPDGVNEGPAGRARLDEEQIVVLDVGDESYGIPVTQVREIIRVPPITRVPNGPGFLEGVINLRGQVIPVMDLRKHLGIPFGDETRRTRVVVSELGRYTVGLMVDAVSEVVMVAKTDIEPPPALIAGANDGQVRGVARLGERLVLFLDPDRVLPNS